MSIFRGQDLLNVLFSIPDKAGALCFRKPLKNVISVCVPKSLLNFWLLLTSDVICVTFLQIRVCAKRGKHVHYEYNEARFNKFGKFHMVPLHLRLLLFCRFCPSPLPRSMLYNSQRICPLVDLGNQKTRCWCPAFCRQ